MFLCGHPFFVNMKNFDVLLWDVDNTLLNFEKTEDYALRNSFLEFQLPFDEAIKDTYQKINKNLWKQLEEQTIQKDDVIYGRFEKLFETLEITSIDARLFQDYYQRVLANTYFVQDDSITLCQKYKGLIKQYIVTNGVKKTQETKLSLSGINQIMDAVFISEEIGYPKPDPRFFDFVFQNIGSVQKDRVLIVGDSLSSDIKGGLLYGIKTCWYNPENVLPQIDIKTDFTISNLWEIEQLL